MEEKIAYLDWMKLQQYTGASLTATKSLCGIIKDYLHENSLKINGENLSAFILHLGEEKISFAYQKQFHWCLKNYSRYYLQNHGKKLSLVLPKLPKINDRREALNHKQVQQIEDWINDLKRDKYYYLYQALWVLFYGLGLRKKEALNLELKHLHLQGQFIEIQTLKNGQKRLLPLSPKQIQILLDYIQQSRPQPKAGFESYLLLGKRGGKAEALLQESIEIWQEKTKLGGALCWHVLRHTIATQLVAKGMNLRQVQLFLGHSSLASTAIYLHPNKHPHEL